MARSWFWDGKLRRVARRSLPVLRLHSYFEAISTEKRLHAMDLTERQTTPWRRTPHASHCDRYPGRMDGGGSRIRPICAAGAHCARSATSPNRVRWRDAPWYAEVP